MTVINGLSPSFLNSVTSASNEKSKVTNFNDFLSGYTTDAVETLHQNEISTLQNINGTADISELLPLLADSELKVAELMAIHEKVLNALNQLLNQTAL